MNETEANGVGNHKLKRSGEPTGFMKRFKETPPVIVASRARHRQRIFTHYDYDIINAMQSTSCTDKAMKISAKARYALRIVLDVAANSSSDALRRGQEIAKSQNISEKFLSRLVIPLREKGILMSVRGAAGGFRLACKPEKIRLLDIVQSVQGSFAILDCLKPGVQCPKECSCLARKVWGEINSAFMKILSRHTVASILKQKQNPLEVIGC